jgi:integrase
MSRPVLTRSNGIDLGRLPNYDKTPKDELVTHPKAIALRLEMKRLVTVKAQIRVNGRQSSDRTIEAAVDVLCEICDRIWRLGYRIERVGQIREDHIRAVVRDHWANGCSPGHLAHVMTQLYKFDDWIGKPGLVRKKESYLPEVNPAELTVKQVAVKSKSWAGNGINVEEKIKDADELDRRFGLMLRMELAFGLRRCEVLQVRPWLDDKGDRLSIRAGIAKGGRPRDIVIDNFDQRQILDFVKSQISNSEFLGWNDRRENGKGLLDRNEQRYIRFMRSIGISRKDSGVTGHGLRAQYAENSALLAGLLPATLGGTVGQMPTKQVHEIRLQVSENLGHSRTSITGSYYGTLKKKLSSSRGFRLPSIMLPGQQAANLFVNPPPMQNVDGSFTVLTIRQRASTDIVVVFEDLTGPISREVGESRVIINKDGIHFEEKLTLEWSDEIQKSIISTMQTLLAEFGLMPNYLRV